MIRAIIVDDEQNSSEVLEILLKESCTQVQILANYHSAELALTGIPKLKPDLLFLDIEMPNMNGFQLLEKLPNKDFEVIFTTSYDQYAIKAFKFSALDYLLKPIDRLELQQAVGKLARPSQHNLSEQLSILMQRISQPPSAIQKIALPTMQRLELVPVSSIISCTSNNNYTEFILSDKRKILVSRTLKDVEEMLQDYSFVRVHNSHIVNLNDVTRYIKGEGGYLIMSDGSTIDVSRGRKELLMQKLQLSKL